MADTLWDEILNQLCAHRQYFLLAVGLIGVFLLLTIVGFAVISPGTNAYVMNAMNLVGLSIFLVIFGAITVYCYRSNRAYR